MQIYKNINMWADYLSPDTLYAFTTNGVVKNNGELVMGRGTAKQVADMHPDIPRILGDMVTAYGNRPFLLPYNLVSIPTKQHWKDEADLALIRFSLAYLDEILDIYQPKRLCLPLPGAGAGNLGIDFMLEELPYLLDTENVTTEVNVFYYDKEG